MEDNDGLIWRKARASAAQNGCVEVANTGDRVLVRDTKDHGRGQVHKFKAEEWCAFVGSVKTARTLTGP